MKLYEYQAKEIFRKLGLLVPKGKLVTRLEDVEEAYQSVGPKVMIKAQVLVGGRGKAGGIKPANSLEEAKKIASSLLHSNLKGLEVKRLLFEEQLNIAREYYMAVVNDRERACPLAMVSLKGGMDIEEVAKHYPDQVATLPIDILYGLQDFQARQLAFQIGLPSQDLNPFTKLLKGLYDVYRAYDAELTEINPLVVTAQGELKAADGRLNVDDNSLFRHPDVAAWQEPGIDAEFKAKKGNAYVELDGNIGLMCTGAGMTMAIMDTIAAFGGKPADFMDVGWGMLEGGAEEGIKLLLAKGVKVILISTYTGARTDIMAEKILEALPRIPNLNIPVVIRLQGKNEEIAQKMLSECQLPYVKTAETLDKAVELAVNVARRGPMSILVNKHTRVIFQGITGKLGQYYSLQMIEYGTQVVAGVTPGKKGQVVNGVPVYNTIKEAKEKHGADCVMVFVPAPFTKDAFMECIDAEVDLILCLTEGVPVQDMMVTRTKLNRSRTKLLGPNSPGIVTPGQFISGLMPREAFVPGNIGIVSRSGTLTYQTAEILNRAGFGESTCLGIGGDPIGGLGFVDVLALFEKDPETKIVVMIGEIGGQGEEAAAAFIKKNMTKPVVAFVAGQSAPEGKTMGHAGAIISAGKGTYQSKAKAFEEAGVGVAKIITDIPKLVKEKMKG